MLSRWPPFTRFTGKAFLSRELMFDQLRGRILTVAGGLHRGTSLYYTMFTQYVLHTVVSGLFVIHAFKRDLAEKLRDWRIPRIFLSQATLLRHWFTWNSNHLIFLQSVHSSVLQMLDIMAWQEIVEYHEHSRHRWFYSFIYLFLARKKIPMCPTLSCSQRWVLPRPSQSHPQILQKQRPSVSAWSCRWHRQRNHRSCRLFSCTVECNQEKLASPSSKPKRFDKLLLGIMGAPMRQQGNVLRPKVVAKLCLTGIHIYIYICITKVDNVFFGVLKDGYLRDNELGCLSGLWGAKWSPLVPLARWNV